MSRTLVAHRARKRTVRQLAGEVDRLRERVEDLEDLRDLNEAVEQNNRKPLISWAKAKKRLGIE